MALLTTQQKNMLNKGLIRRDMYIGDRLANNDTDGTISGSATITGVTGTAFTVNSDSSNPNIALSAPDSGTGDYTLTIAAPGTLGSNRTITLPEAGAGTFYFAVTTNSDGSVGSTGLDGTTADTFEINNDGNGAILSSASLTADRTYTFPDASDELAGKAATQTLTNKTLTAPTINACTITGAVTITTPSVTGTWTDLGTVTTADINGGSIDGVTIGAAAAPTVTNLGTVTTCDINGGTIDGTVIGGASAAAGTFAALAGSSLAIGGGYGDTGASISAAGAIQANGAITSDGAVTGDSLTDGTVTISSGSVTGTWVDLGTVTTVDIDGGSIDGATIGAASAGAITGTTITGTTLTDGTASITGGDISAVGTLTATTLTDGTATITGGVAASLSIDGDTNTVTDLDHETQSVQASSGGAYVGQSFVVEFRPAAAGNLDYSVPAGKKLRVLNAWGFKTVGAGAHADDELTLSNNGANNIFATEELNTVTDGSFFQFDALDDAYNEVAGGNALRLTANENAAGGCDAVVYVQCAWVTA